MRKTTSALIMTLLIIAAAGTTLVNLTTANPYRYIDKWVPPPADAVPLTISVSSPQKNAAYDANGVTVAFTVTTQGTSIDAIGDTHFVASWLKDNVTVSTQDLHEFATYNETFHDMPDGNYNLVITATGGGSYIDPTRIDYFDGTIYHFTITTTAIINFTIATPLEIRVLSPNNETYNSTEISLNLIINKPFSKASYVLDHQENITIARNVTLSGLTDGFHSLTVYAWDNNGKVGASETLKFNVDAPEQSSALLISAISIAVAGTVSAGVLLYLKRRGREVIKL